MLTPQLLLDAVQLDSPRSDWLTLLSQKLPHPREQLLAMAADLSGYILWPADAQTSLNPVFDKLSYTEMVDRHLIVGLDHHDRLCVMIGRPYDRQLGQRLAQLPALHEIYLADPQAIRALLDTHESS